MSSINKVIIPFLLANDANLSYKAIRVTCHLYAPQLFIHLI